MTFDRDRNVTVLFGGGDGTQHFGDTWEWNGSNWTQYYPEINPGPREESAVAYDTAHQEVVLFGGQINPGNLIYVGDTWVYPKNVCLPPVGACCDRNSGLGGLCTEEVIEKNCQNELQSWTILTDCFEITCEEITGACCDIRPGLGGICSDDVLIADCQDEFDTWSADTLCSEIFCEEVTGACCDISSGLGGLCLDQFIQADCQGEQQTWVIETPCIEITCEEVTGACCDRLDGFCRNGLLQSECDGAQPIWNEGVSCSEILCDPAMGACCNARFGTCTKSIITQCSGTHLNWTKGENCSAQNCPDPFVPAVSEWGMVIMTLLLLIGGKLYFGYRYEFQVEHNQ